MTNNPNLSSTRHFDNHQLSFGKVIQNSTKIEKENNKQTKQEIISGGGHFRDDRNEKKLIGNDFQHSNFWNK